MFSASLLAYGGYQGVLGLGGIHRSVALWPGIHMSGVRTHVHLAREEARLERCGESLGAHRRRGGHHLIRGMLHCLSVPFLFEPYHLQDDMRVRWEDAKSQTVGAVPITEQLYQGGLRIRVPPIRLCWLTVFGSATDHKFSTGCAYQTTGSRQSAASNPKYLCSQNGGFDEAANSTNNDNRDQRDPRGPSMQVAIYLW